MKVTISVTQMHINMARGTIPVPPKYMEPDSVVDCMCPIDYAAFDVLGQGWAAGTKHLEHVVQDVGIDASILMPEEARRFIYNYDHGGNDKSYPSVDYLMLPHDLQRRQQAWRDTRPFSFEIEIPDELLTKSAEEKRG